VENCLFSLLLKRETKRGGRSRESTLPRKEVFLLKDSLGKDGMKKAGVQKKSFF